MTTQSRSGEKIKVAVITGHHPYDVVGLQALFRSLPEIDAYPQNLEDFVTDTGGSRGGYEVVVFYNYHVPTPGNEQFPLGGNVREVLEELGETEQGIFVLHHAILAYPDWPLWQQIVGDIRMDRSRPVLQEQSVRIQNVAPGHPITEGITSFEVLDDDPVLGADGLRRTAVRLLGLVAGDAARLGDLPDGVEPQSTGQLATGRHRSRSTGEVAVV